MGGWRRCGVIAATAALVTALAMNGCGPAADDLCGRLAATKGCDPSAQQKCTDALASAKSAEPSCAALIDALAKCIAPLKLSCNGATSLSANGTGDIGGGQNFTSVGGYDLVVNDAKCDVERRGLEACRTCADAAGATKPGVLGVSDRCGAAPCAPGLACQGGICTKACATDDDCKARADGCKLQFQYPNVCKDGTCTRSCGSDTSCSVWVSSTSKCVSKACTL